MAAFNFPDPTIQQTVTNPITGSTYQWKEPPGKWVITTKVRAVSDIIYEGDTPPTPRGEYKLWYSTDTLELYFWYEDINGVGAWVPTSAPITMLEDLDTGLSEVKLELVAANVAINENTNRIESFIYFGEEAPDIYPDVDTGSTTPDGTDEGAPIFEQDERNYKLWLNTTTDKLSVLRIDEGAEVGYSYQEINTDNNVTLQEVLDNGNTADKGAVFAEPVSVGFDEFDPQESHAVSFGYYDEGQAAQNERIGELQDSVAVLQQEIEALGETINKSVPHTLIKKSDDTQNILNDGGMYFGDCPNGNLLDIPDDWSGICFIYVDTRDNNGDFADFGPDTLDPGDLIEGVSETGYFLVEVGQGGYDEGAGKKIAGIEAKLIKASGVPGDAGTEYALTAFRLTANGGIDLPTADERYVKKNGDQMAGKLDIRPVKNSSGLWVYAPQGDAGAGQAAATQLVRVANSSNQFVFYVEESGAIAGKIGMVPTDDRHLVSKKYVDDALARLNTPSPFCWKRQNKSSGTPSSGYWYIYGGFIYLSYYTHNGAELRTSTAIKDKKANDFNGAAVMMSFWKFENNKYELVQTCEAFKWRGTYNGVLQLEVHRNKIDWGTIPYEELHYISVPSFF